MLFADMLWHPTGMLAWMAVGLITGWLAGHAVGEGGYGAISDIVLGLIGAMVGGFVHSIVQGDNGGGVDPWFWGSVGFAFLGACALVGGGRFLGMGRQN